MIENRNNKLKLPRVKLGRLWVHQLKETEVVNLLLDNIENGQGGWLITPNIDYIRRCQKDDAFLKLCNNADLSLADGMPLVWASMLLKTPLPERVAGSNLIVSLSCSAAKRGHSIYLIGGDPGTAEEAAEILKLRCPGLKIAGIDPLPLGFEENPGIIENLIFDLKEKKPAIIFVALGSPKEENLCEYLSQRITQGWFLPIGISYSYLCGRVKRAPIWMQNIGLEWFYRLLMEPRRLAVRYLFYGLPFAILFLFRSAYQGWQIKGAQRNLGINR